jgi:hypothetical protein
MNRVALVAGIMTLLLGSAACSSVQRARPEVDRSSDARILVDVQQRIASEPTLDSRGLRVEVNGGIVLLYGSVNGIGEWECALRNASLVQGVRSVVDYLVLERGPRDIDCRAVRNPGVSMARILPLSG